MVHDSDDRSNTKRRKISKGSDIEIAKHSKRETNTNNAGSSSEKPLEEIIDSPTSEQSKVTNLPPSKDLPRLTSTLSEQQDAQLKRRRGRPRRSSPVSLQEHNGESAVLNSDAGQPLIRKRGRPRKAETTPLKLSALSPPTTDRRKSERGHQLRSPNLESSDPTVKIEEQPSTALDQEFDTRKRHANGKPMGRPRKSDLILHSTAVGPSEKPSNAVNPDGKSTRGQNTQKSTGKRRVGRPRKGEEQSLYSPNTAVGSSDINKKRKTNLPRSSSTIDQIVDDGTKSIRRGRTGPRKIKLTFDHAQARPIITHSAHVVPQPQYQSLTDYLTSFVSLDEDISFSAAQEWRETHKLLRSRVLAARESGILGHALRGPLPITKPTEPIVPLCHQDQLSVHARFFSKLMQEERKRNYSNARKVASMILNHFKKVSGADEREHAEFLRFQRQTAKRIANEIRRKWRLAEKELHRRLQSKLQAEQRAAGKLQLNQILEHSTNLLDARRNGPDSFDAFSETSSDSCEDHYLSIEELRQKYANVPDLVLEADVSVDERMSRTTDTPDRQDLEQETDESNSAMDSEDDLSTSDGSHTSDSHDSPGLSSLYPELSGNIDIRYPASDCDSDAHSLSFGAKDLFAGVEDSAKTSDPSSRPPLHHRGMSTNLIALESDDDAHDIDDNSPMDSEMEDSCEGSQSDEEADDGPGLTWLYSTPFRTLDAPELVPTESTQPVVETTSDTHIHTPARFPSEGQSPTAEHASNVKVKTPVPILLRGTLREYQHTGLDWMAGLYLSETNGILADEMGLGKTIQTISLLTWLACDQHVWGPHLIVVPTSVMLNWEMEFKKFSPGLKVLTYYGNPKERKEKRRGWSKSDTVHVVITSYQLVISDASVFRRKRWEYMILDEAHNIKNFKSQRWQTMLNFNTKHRLLLTGTPLQNNLNELWSLLYFLMPKGLSMNPSFANLADFQEWFARPVDKLIEDGNGRMDDEARVTVAKLHQILRPYILRRLKADVEKQMPGKYEHIITCRLSKRQRYLYDDFMSRSGTRSILASGNFLSIINCFMQLRKVCNHPDLFESRPIVTSFAMRKSAIASYEVNELCVRRRLLAEDHSSNVSLRFLNLRLVIGQAKSCVHANLISRLCKSLEHDRLARTDVETTSESQSGNSVSRKSLDLSRYADSSSHARSRHQDYINKFRCSAIPIYGSEIISRLQFVQMPAFNRAVLDTTGAIRCLRPTIEMIAGRSRVAVSKFACITPKAIALDLPALALPFGRGFKQYVSSFEIDSTHFARTATSIAFPDRRLLQFDCGKLQRLSSLLRELIGSGHRVLIFTQMTKMLDILEQFLNIHGHRYFRLDGSTKIEVRQTLTETFNNDARIPVFILSTRSGGLGINLTGADTVIFYDSDWNPSMDRQCQDRAHRIGQTRDVHIYRFVSEYTIEQNILRKANQKRMLDNVVIGEGDFTTDFFDKVDWKDMLGDEVAASVVRPQGSEFENALAAVEDEDDVRAAKVAQQEMNVDATEFADNGPPRVHTIITGSDSIEEDIHEDEEDSEVIGSIDEYMINFLERELAGLQK